MSMIVPRASLDLANLARIDAAKNIAELADLDAPPGARAQLRRESPTNGDLACQRITKAPKKIEKGKVPRNADQRLQERRQKKPADPAIESVRHPAIIYFREIVPELRMSDRINQSRQIGADRKS